MQTVLTKFCERGRERERERESVRKKEKEKCGKQQMGLWTLHFIIIAILINSLASLVDSVD